jgi:hypothetical protein
VLDGEPFLGVIKAQKKKKKICCQLGLFSDNSVSG